MIVFDPSFLNILRSMTSAPVCSFFCRFRFDYANAANLLVRRSVKGQLDYIFYVRGDGWFIYWSGLGLYGVGIMSKMFGLHPS